MKTNSQFFAKGALLFIFLISLIVVASMYSYVSNRAAVPNLPKDQAGKISQVRAIEIAADGKGIVNAETKEIIFTLDEAKKYLKDAGYEYNPDTFQTTNAKYAGNCFMEAKFSNKKDRIVFSTGCLAGDLPQAWIGIYNFPKSHNGKILDVVYAKFRLLSAGSGKNFTWSEDDKSVAYVADLGLSGMTEERTIDSETGEILEKASGIKTGKGELDANVDVAKLQAEMDQGDQSWRKYLRCYDYGCGDINGKNGIPVEKPWRLDPNEVLQRMGKSFGFPDYELEYDSARSIIHETGKIVYDVKHGSGKYFVTVSQPLAGQDKIWIISEIKPKLDACNPPLVGMRFNGEGANRVFEEIGNRLKPIVSPEQFTEKKYQSYCIDWYNFESLPESVLEKLDESDVYKNLDPGEIEKWNLYSNDTNLGIRFKYPAEWKTFSEDKIGSFYKLYFTGKLEIYLSSSDRSGKWSVVDVKSVVVGGEKTFLAESANDWKKENGVVRGRHVAYLTKVSNFENKVYVEHGFSYDPQSPDAAEVIKKHKSIFGGVLSTFQFIRNSKAGIITEKASLGNMEAYNTQINGRNHAVLSVGEKETTLDSGRAYQENMPDVGNLKAFSDFKFSPAGDYLTYRETGWEWSWTRIYDIKNNTLIGKRFSSSHAAFTDDEKYYFDCEANAMGGEFYARVYKLPGYSVAYEMPVQKGETAGNNEIACEYDKNKNAVKFTVYNTDGAGNRTVKREVEYPLANAPK